MQDRDVVDPGAAPEPGAMDRLAEHLIDEVLAGEVADRQSDLDLVLARFAAARRELAAAERELRAWRRRGEFGYRTGTRALTAARFADFVPSAVPPGTHVAALTEYLRRHGPTWEVPSTPRSVTVTVTAARRAAKRAAGSLRRLRARR